MGDHECINTELGLAIKGNSTYSKCSVPPPPVNSEEQERPLHKEELMASRRKKLRLTKEQSDILEESYRAHNTLTSIQKAELAEKLYLQRQQVEVWFQNRRARAKLKQIKKDREYLKELCDSLRDENQRLKTEILELRTLQANQN